MHRISLENEFLEGANNVYLLDDDITTLVDTGYDTPGIRDEIVDGFESVGLRVEDLDRIYVTHYHIDHTGLLGWLVSRSDATVYAHPGDQPLVEGDQAAWRRMEAERDESLEDWAVPDSTIETFKNTLVDEADVVGDQHVEPLEVDVDIDLGETIIRPLHTPGHSLGHSAFVLPDRNEVLTGDALLPIYTPNVGGADIRLEDSLASYIRTLERMASESFDRAWPGHRQPIDDPSDRAMEIIRHHEERAVRVLQILDDQDGATAWEVSRTLFGTLDGVHILHGPGEAAAHLEHLHQSGEVRRDGRAYELTAETTELLAEDPDAWSLTD